MENNQGIVIVGASGHAKTVISTLRAANWPIKGLVDDNQELWDTEVLGHPVLGGLTLLEEEPGNPVIFGIVDNAIRKIIAERFAELNWQTVIHPRAVIDPTVRISKGTLIGAGVVIQPDVMISEHCIINTNSSIAYDTTVGAYSHLAPGVHVADHVNLGEGCMLGIGCCVIPNIAIAEWATIGAGSVVVHAIPSQVVAFGVPAVVKEYFQEVSQ